MQWTHLIRPTVESWFPEQLAKQAEEFAGKVDALLAERRQHDEAVERTKNEDPATFDPSNVVTFRGHLDMQIRLLQRELQLRRELAEYLDAFYRELSAEANNAFRRREKAEAGIRIKLVQLGYADVPPNYPDLNKITPEFVARHPKVREARDEARSLASRRSSPDWLNENNDAIDALTKQLTQLRDQALRT